MVALSSIMSVSITGKINTPNKNTTSKNQLTWAQCKLILVHLRTILTHTLLHWMSLWLWVIGDCSSSERRTIKPLLTGWRISCCQRGLKIGNVTSCGFWDIYCHSLHFYSFKPNALGARHHEQCPSHAQAQI